MQTKARHLGFGVALAAAMTSGAAAQEVVDWSGFYAGIYGGYALDTDGASSSSTGPATFNFGGGAINGTIASSTGRIEGLIGGVVTGYTYQHDKLVLGVEAGLHLGDYGKADTSTLGGTATDGVNTVTLSFDENARYNVDWYTALVGRVGFAHDRWLFTLKGGVVVANASIQADSRLFVDDPGGLILPAGTLIDVPGTSSASELVVGPTFGFGAETMIAENVSVSAEYTYVSLPDISAPSAGLGGLLGGGGGPVFGASMHQLKAGVKYHF